MNERLLIVKAKNLVHLLLNKNLINQMILDFHYAFDVAINAELEIFAANKTTHEGTRTKNSEVTFYFCRNWCHDFICLHTPWLRCVDRGSCVFGIFPASLFCLAWQT